MKTALLLVAVVVLGLAAWVRLAPSVPEAWHSDPRLAPDPGPGGARLLPGEGAPVYAASPEAVLAALADVAAGEGRTRLLARDGTRATWIVRSRLWGFPDYVTAEAVPVPGGTALALLSRLRFGRGDLGVNRARLGRWVAALDRALPRAEP